MALHKTKVVELSHKKAHLIELSHVCIKVIELSNQVQFASY